MKTNKLNRLKFLSDVIDAVCITTFLAWIVGWFLTFFGNLPFVLIVSTFLLLILKGISEIVDKSLMCEVNKHIKYNLQEMKEGVLEEKYEAFKSKYLNHIKYDPKGYSHNFYRLFMIYNHKIKKGL